VEKKHKIELSVQCTEKEHEEAWFIVQYRCGILRFWPLVFVAALLFVAAASYAFHVKKAYELLAAGFCILSVTLPVVYFWYSILYVNKRRRHYLQKYMSVGERKLLVFEHSVSIKSDCVSTDIPFEDCVYLVEKKTYFLLIQNRRGYLIIPKRDVPCGEMDVLRKRLKRCSAVYRVFHRG